MQTIFQIYFLGTSERLKIKLLDFFIEIIEDKENYNYLPFEEFLIGVMFDYGTDNLDRDRIINVIIQNFKEMCESTNKMIPFLFMDFIDFYCTYKQKEYFLKHINAQYKILSQLEEHYLKLTTRHIDRNN